MSNESTTAAQPASFNWRFWSASIPVLLVQLMLVYSAAGWTEAAPASPDSPSQAAAATAPEHLPQAAAVAVPAVAAFDTPEMP